MTTSKAIQDDVHNMIATLEELEKELQLEDNSEMKENELIEMFSSVHRVLREVEIYLITGIMSDVRKKNVIFKRPVDFPSYTYLSVILVELPDNKQTPYATYIHNASRGEFGMDFSGHYFADLQAAYEDWKVRR